MDFEFFNERQLVLVKQNSKSTLYDLSINSRKDVVLIPFNRDTTDVSYIRVEDKLRLVFTEKAMYNFEGQLITNFPRKIFDILTSLTGNSLIVAHAEMGNHFRFILWNGSTIIADFAASSLKTSEYNFAVEQNGFWEIYSFSGSPIVLAEKLSANRDLKLYKHFAVYLSVGNNKLISLDKGCVLCEGLISVSVSSHHDFAICASLNKKVVTYYNGKCKTFENIDSFTIVDENKKLYALHQNGKYHLYQFNGNPLYLDKELDEGFDFVASKDELLMVINEGKHYFFQTVH